MHVGKYTKILAIAGFVFSEAIASPFVRHFTQALHYSMLTTTSSEVMPTISNFFFFFNIREN